jgi:hypothetical protein
MYSDLMKYFLANGDLEPQIRDYGDDCYESQAIHWYNKILKLLLLDDRVALWPWMELVTRQSI